MRPTVELSPGELPLPIRLNAKADGCQFHVQNSTLSCVCGSQKKLKDILILTCNVLQPWQPLASYCARRRVNTAPVPATC